MAHPEASFVASIVVAERNARKRLREAEGAGAQRAAIRELTSTWYDLLSTLLRSYATPANWQQGLPQGVIPRDTAAALGEQMSLLAADPNPAERSDLASALTSACEEFRRNRGNDDGGRKGVSRALKILIDHLQDADPIMKEKFEPLYFLAASLDELDKTGKADPILVPRRSPRRPREPEARWLLKQVVAAAVEVLMDDGQCVNAAEAYVTRRLTRIGMSISDTTVGNWRSNVREHLPTGKGRVREYLHILCEWEGKKNEIPSKEWVSALIDGVQSIARVHSTKKVR
jgi:hypothetical protein